MLTDKEVRIIQKQKSDWTQEQIRTFDREWNAAVRRIKGSHRDLSKLPIVPEQTEYRNVRT